MDSSHPDWRVMVPHCGFDLHFSDDEWRWASVCLLWRNICLVLWPIFDWVIYFSGIELEELLVYFWGTCLEEILVRNLLVLLVIVLCYRSNYLLMQESKSILCLFSVLFQYGRRKLYLEDPGEGNGNPFQCCCLKNPMDRGAWRATVHGGAKSQTGLSDSQLHFPVCVWACADLLQLSPTLCDFLDCSLAGSSVHGILQERTLEWVMVPFSMGSSPLRDWTYLSLSLLSWQMGSLPVVTAGKLFTSLVLFNMRKRLYLVDFCCFALDEKMDRNNPL